MFVVVLSMEKQMLFAYLIQILISILTCPAVLCCSALVVVRLLAQIEAGSNSPDRKDIQLLQCSW